MSQTNTYELARTYVDHVAQVEQSARWRSPHDRLSEASQQFGQLCVEAAENGTLPYIASVQAQLGKIVNQHRESAAERNRAELFGVSIDWLRHGNISRCQRRLQELTAEKLAESLINIDERPKKFHGLILGDIGELAILGSVNFMDDPNYFAMPSPPHHDEHPKKHLGYDIALISGSHLRVQPVQVKFGCQNFCHNPTVGPHKANKQGLYGHGIALVSGHCDAGMQFDQRSSNGNLSLADAITRSVMNPLSITNDEFELLFHVGDTLIENLTGAELKDRLGMATSRHLAKAGPTTQLQAEGISPRARRKALRVDEEQPQRTNSRRSKGYTNKPHTRKSDRRIRGGRAADFAY